MNLVHQIKSSFLDFFSNKRKVAFYLFTCVLAVMNLTIMHSENYLIRMSIRIPQVLIMLWIYKKFVDPSPMRTMLTKVRVKGPLHHVLIIFGVLLYVTFIIVTNQLNVPTSQPVDVQLIEFQKNISKFGVVEISLAFVLSALLAIPIIYAILQTIFYCRIFIVWVYNNHVKYLWVAIIFEDIFILGIVSVIR
ncbi:hypothetical protein [Paenibacillus agilis]|uniref:Uncharacterized protein n=1 Tax=Paenibacillus agilis TaxID=3020863 RepID=A0A559ID40_9BACL|nr:hypothetical protein [Paenibacillus agilis]TVX85587.1 hypothetical protein FPZ44_24845 [Paenibacillus agilis]